MILMMVLPLLLITVLPKMMNDPETKREMEQMHQSMNVQNQVRNNTKVQVRWCNTIHFKTTISYKFSILIIIIVKVPEISEIMANLFGGGGSGSNTADKSKKRQKPHVARRS